MLKKISSEEGVSEVLGVVLLLGMTVLLFTFLNSNVSEFSLGSPAPVVNLVGTIDKPNNMIYVEHNGGDSLERTTEISITIGSKNYPRNVSDLLIDNNNDNKWNFGETLQFSYEGIDVTDKFIGVTVIGNNAVLLSVILQYGLG
jgi:hypothetical protein